MIQEEEDQSAGESPQIVMPTAVRATASVPGPLQDEGFALRLPGGLGRRSQEDRADVQPLGARGTDGLKSARNLLLPRPLNQAEARLGKKSQGAKTLLTQRAGRNSQSGRLVYKSSKSKPVFRPPQSKHLQETVATEVSLQ